MNKKGFTIVEILAVIVILAFILIITIPAVSNSSKKAKERTYQTKVKLIESSAVLFGQDNYGAIVAQMNANLTKCTYKTESTNKICELKLKDLVPDYVTADIDRNSDMIEDPRTKGVYLDEKKIIITINTKTRKVTAKMND